MKNFSNETSGSTLPVFALSLMAVMALVGATIALGMDSRAAGNLQATADSAALSGATAFINASSPKADDRLQEAERLAISIANSNSDYVLRDLEIAAVVEDPYGQHTKIDVDMAFEPVNAMAKVAGRNANVKITRTASAEATWGFPLCTLSLSETDPALTVSGQSNLTAKNCLLWANSTDMHSFDFDGGDVETKYLCTAGKARIGLGSVVKPSPAEQCRKIPDPLAKWKAPTHGTPVTLADYDVNDAASADPEMLIHVKLFLKDPAETDMFFSYVTEMLLIGGDNLDPADPATEQSMLGQGGLLSTEAILTQIEGPGTGKGWFHPKLNLFTSAETSLYGLDAKINNGPGVGLTLIELAQEAGLMNNGVPEEPITNDRYFDAVTDKITPGTYNGLDISEGHILLLPGIYHIVDAPLNVRRRATLTGDGVTIILHGTDATFNVLDEARLTLSAPTEGATAGFALAQRRESIKGTNFDTSRLNGDGKASLIGTVYLPKQNIEIGGKGTGDQASPLLQIVANKMELKEEGRLRIEFDTSKTDVPVVIKPQRTARLTN